MLYHSCPEFIMSKGTRFERVNLNRDQSLYRNILELAKGKGLKYRTIKVLSKHLRGKTDLHHKPYEPRVYLYVEVKNPLRVESLDSIHWLIIRTILMGKGETPSMLIGVCEHVLSKTSEQVWEAIAFLERTNYIKKDEKGRYQLVRYPKLNNNESVPLTSIRDHGEILIEHIGRLRDRAQTYNMLQDRGFISFVSETSKFELTKFGHVLLDVNCL